MARKEVHLDITNVDPILLLVIIVLFLFKLSIAPLINPDIDYRCGIDTCIYYNESMYYSWCDSQYGKGNWVMRDNLVPGFRGNYLGHINNIQPELSYSSGCNFNDSIITKMLTNKTYHNEIVNKWK